ncbi:MAG TPA: SDR family oxidoreductase [Terriglobales bacterium]|jgi:short-subunit dehydrogenase|nr:SDR family oxidoreductase [Terriglobales bacterium]
MANFKGTLVRRLIFSGAVIGGGTAALAASTMAGAVFAYWSVKQVRRFNLSGRTVLITGGSRGLGLALARAFLRRGAKVALLGREVETLERARQLLAGKGMVFVRPADVRDPSQVNQAVLDVQQEFGDIDVLVNNAGTLTVGPMDTMTPKDYQEALNVYFWGPFHLAQAVLPSMRQRKTGRIVNISSIGGKISVPHLLPYCTGKFALSGWSEGMRQELTRDNVYVTTVYPGLMRTGSPRNAEFKGKHRDEYTWFTLSDAMPGLSISADRAARQIVTACEYGRAELIVSLPARIAIKAHALLPSMSSLALRFTNQLLPQAEGAPEQAGKKGSQSETAATRSFLTVLDKQAAQRNNQVPNPSPVTT